MQDSEEILESGFNPAPVTDRVNIEPPILNGMAAGEAQYIGLVSAGLGGLLALVLQALTGGGILLLLLVIIVPLLCLWYGSLYLQKVKRGRPDGFYIQMMHLHLASKGIVRPYFVLHKGYWDIGR